MRRRLFRAAVELWPVPPLLAVLALASGRERDDPYDPIGGGFTALGPGPDLSDAQAVMLASTWAILLLLLVSLLLSAAATKRSRPARGRYLAATLALAALVAVVAALWPERADYPDPANHQPPPLFLEVLD